MSCDLILSLKIRERITIISGCLAFLLFLFSFGIFAGAPDYRPQFDKTPYQGTLWTQVNGWWYPAKQRVDGYGGPNYARKKYESSSQWGEALKDSFKYGNINWQVELHVPAPKYAETLKKIMKQAREQGVDAKFSIFLVYYGKKGKLADQISKTVNQLKMLKDELKSEPAIFRINGAPVISVYSSRYFTPEEWGKVIPEVEKQCGKFIWLMNTCCGPALDSNSAKGSKWVRRYLPYFDGVSQYGNYSTTSQAKLYEWLAKIMHNEYPHKIFEVSVQNTYSNHFHFGGNITKLSRKWRKSIETAIKAKPDSIVYTNFFDHYENSLVLPCYEREDFLLRYGQYWISKWRNKPFPKQKQPELVLNNHTSIMLGEDNLNFEVIGFPIDNSSKSVKINLDICDTAGKVLYTFPERNVNLSKLSVETFSIPSVKFYKQRGIVPRLRYLWNGRNYKMNYNPMTLISPSMCTNMMFWSRSTKNSLICNVVDSKWSIDSTLPGKTLSYPVDGIASIYANVKCSYGKSARQGFTRFRLMRNGIEYFSHSEKKGGMAFNRAVLLVSPADALNYYHLELENSEGYRYQTRPVWVSNNRRRGDVKMPVWNGKNIVEYDIEAVRVPFYYYPCKNDNGALLLDYSGYLHNGRFNGKGYGGGHLGNTGYYHYHNGSVAPITKSILMRDSTGKGFWRFSGNEYIMIMGGTAFPGAATYEIFVRPKEFGKVQGILGTANGQINLSIEPDGRIKTWRNSKLRKANGNRKKITKEVISKNKISLNQWNHVAVVYDLKEIKLYINGKLEGTASISPFRGLRMINHMTIGSLCKWIWTPINKFSGDIRDIRIYGRNLQPAEFLNSDQ